MRPGCSSRVVDNGSVLFAKPPPFCSPRATKERAREPGKETERERELGPVACGRHLGVHKAPRTAHIPSNPIHPSPRRPSLFFSESLSLFSLPAHSLMERGFSKSTKWLERSWTDWSLKGPLSKSTAQITASQLSTASKDGHYCKILNTIYFPRTFCLETSFTDGWEKYLWIVLKTQFLG